MQPGGYRLDVDDVDIAAAGRLVSEARDAAVADAARAAGLLGDALDLWRGDPLDARLALARLCALDGCDDEAGRWFAAARIELEAQSARPLRAVVDHDEGLMHIRHGSGAAARPLTSAAAEQIRDLGMTGWTRRLDR